jgi:hypothetical protein
MFARFAVAILLGLFVSSACLAQSQSKSLVGCYRASHRLGFDALKGGSPYPVDQHFFATGEGPGVDARFRLLDGGRVERPSMGMESSWAAGSRWQLKRDTLIVELSQLAIGWYLRLPMPRAEGDSLLLGDAQPISDVVDVSQPQAPPRVKVRIIREGCSPT